MTKLSPPNKERRQFVDVGVFLTKKEFAERIRKSEKTVDRMRAKGLPHVKTGEVMFPEAECMAWFLKKFGRNL